MKDSLHAIAESNRSDQTDQVNQIKIEIAEMEQLLPKQLSKEDLTEIINNLKGENNNIGQIMKHLSTNYSNLYDGKLASQIIKSI
jgi:uncharacterized protein YqeY